MSGQYRPDDSALPGPLWTTIHLANRDLAAQIPINFVTHAGVSLTPACFADGVFENSRAEKCISNLLAAQFRRFIIDLYWDSDLRQFSLCPVSMNARTPSSNSSTTPSTSMSVVSQVMTDASPVKLNTQVTSASDVSQARETTGSAGIRLIPRQLIGSSSRSDSLSVTIGTFENPSATTRLVSTATVSAGDALYTTGPYQCSKTINWQFVASLLIDYIHQTSDTLSVNLLLLQINLHATAAYNQSAGLSTRPLGSALPSSTELVGHAFNAVTSPLPYQLSELLSQRASLNNSWYFPSASEQPISEYFTTEGLEGGKESTHDGWPSASFLELKRYKRILLGWQSIDPQMQGYSFATDDLVFPQNYLSSITAVSSNAAGGIDNGCFYKAKESTVAQANSSWTLSIVNDTSPSFGPQNALWALASNLTSCGISPVLNATLSDKTAAQDASSYARFVESTIWNWAPGEPRNVSLKAAGSQDGTNTDDQFRCAMVDTSETANFSRWRVEYCNIRHRAVCRVDHQPYLWRLSDESVPFAAAESGCPRNSSFSVPRTGLENTYLLQHISSLPEGSRSGLSGADSGVWLNFNSLDTEACWVMTGPNGTCPYFIDEDALRQRTVLVPVVAALVVLLITALTLFVKCNQNRRNSRKRVRGHGGWDYEGVPS